MPDHYFEKTSAEQFAGSKLDDPDFGSMAASRRREGIRTDVNREKASMRARERLARRAYRNALRGKADPVRAYQTLKMAESEGINPFGIRRAGDDLKAAATSVAQKNTLGDRTSRRMIQNELNEDFTNTGGSSQGSLAPVQRDENDVNSDKELFAKLGSRDQSFFAGQIKQARDRNNGVLTKRDYYDIYRRMKSRADQIDERDEKFGEVRNKAELRNLKELNDALKFDGVDDPETRKNIIKDVVDTMGKDEGVRYLTENYVARDFGPGGAREKELDRQQKRRAEGQKGLEPLSTKAGQGYATGDFGVTDRDRKNVQGADIESEAYHQVKDVMISDIQNNRINSDEGVRYLSDLSNLVRRYETMLRAGGGNMEQIFGNKAGELTMPSPEEFRDPDKRNEWAAKFKDYFLKTQESIAQDGAEVLNRFTPDQILPR